MIYNNQRYFELQVAKFTKDGRDANLPTFVAEITAHSVELHNAPTFHAFFDRLDRMAWTIVEEREGSRFTATLAMPCGQRFRVSGTHEDPEQLKFISWRK